MDDRPDPARPDPARPEHARIESSRRSNELAGPFAQVPIEITVTVGRARPLVRDLLRLGADSVLPLDRRVDDAVELYVGDRLIGRGELEEMQGEHEGQLAVRLTELASIKDAL